ncbi:MAG TPA: glycine cleavage system protein GcvH [Casimicrobiaceae bacterium]|nr:glycine cleavage system protein GcvH [Casimicrobiaceae bacterium]
MNIPANLRYTSSHEWIRKELDGTLTIGITDHAQAALGDLVFIELPKVGLKLGAGEACAVVESVKAASDVYAPVAGTVTAVNDEVQKAPEKVNADAYAAWLYRLQPVDAAAIDALLDARGYQSVIAEG